MHVHIRKTTVRESHHERVTVVEEVVIERPVAVDTITLTYIPSATMNAARAEYERLAEHVEVQGQRVRALLGTGRLSESDARTLTGPIGVRR